MPQQTRKTTKTTSHPTKSSRAKSPRKLRDLDTPDPSKVKGGLTVTQPPTSGGGVGAFNFRNTKTIVPCV